MADILDFRIEGTPSSAAYYTPYFTSHQEKSGHNSGYNMNFCACLYRYQQHALKKTNSIGYYCLERNEQLIITKKDFS